MTGSVPSRKERQAETRRRLLAAAADRFTAKGFHGASVSEIAAAAGFTTGALYANFDSKETLFLALIDEHVGEHGDALDGVTAGAEPARMRKRITARVEELVRGLVDGPPAARADGALTPWQLRTLSLEFLLYAVRNRPELRHAIADRHRRFDEQATAVIRRWLDAEGRGARIPPDELALVQSWIVEGLGQRLLADPELVTPARAARLYELFVTELPLDRAWAADPEAVEARAADTEAGTPFQPDPERIEWRLHLRSTPAAVYEALTTDAGRAAFWVERSAQTGDRIELEFPGGVTGQAQVLADEPGRLFRISYFGAVATFELTAAEDGGPDLLLSTHGFAPGDRDELLAGWLNVLFPLKAYVDHGVDLRNHDSRRTWWHGFADQ